jgi:hypothetical protein
MTVRQDRAPTVRHRAPNLSADRAPDRAPGPCAPIALARCRTLRFLPCADRAPSSRTSMCVRPSRQAHGEALLRLSCVCRLHLRPPPAGGRHGRGNAAPNAGAPA